MEQVGEGGGSDEAPEVQSSKRLPTEALEEVRPSKRQRGTAPRGRVGRGRGRGRGAALPAEVKCQVCRNADHKYRCPTCLVR
ncbi:MAG: hypothetical protein Q8P67_19120 [archaeon]|nr:hypothetical protein [archaeon]